jgi:multicomponent Na+:H+ antiporter subunit D
MSQITILWIALPLFLGFSGYLLPKLGRALALGGALVSLAYGLWSLFIPAPRTLEFLDSFGVTLVVDSLSAFFILTNALVTAAVILYSWQTGKSAFFYTQTIILHGSVNAAFICADFMSLYVALEVISIAAFLLIAYPRNDRSIWVGLRYLFISNTAMLFYLIGAVLVYQANHSFAFAGLERASGDAIALIVLGLLTKSGVFLSGLWLPLTHSEAETPVSAILSGVVVKASLFPLVRLALMADDLGFMLALFSVGSAVLGVSYAIFETDTKRMLALSTISQVGFVLATPATAGFYALTHGLAKAALFLIAGNLPSRDLRDLRQTPLPLTLWSVLAIASLSVAGCPLLAGFAAKALTLKALESWQWIVMNLAAVGTTIVFAKFIFLPFSQQSAPKTSSKLTTGFWLAVLLPIGGLIVINGLHLDAYTVENLIKSLITIGLGWLLYFLILRRLTIQLSRGLEQFEQLIGVMSLVLFLLFGMVMA